MLFVGDLPFFLFFFRVSFLRLWVFVCLIHCGLLCNTFHPSFIAIPFLFLRLCTSTLLFFPSSSHLRPCLVVLFFSKSTWLFCSLHSSVVSLHAGLCRKARVVAGQRQVFLAPNFYFFAQSEISKLRVFSFASASSLEFTTPVPPINTPKTPKTLHISPP